MATFLQHKFSGAGTPTVLALTPARLNDHFVDTLTNNTYISVGTASPADWKLVAGSGSDVAFTIIVPTAGSNPVADIAGDTLTILSTDGSVVVTGINDPESLDFEVNPANVDHDALQNFAANEHIDWTVDGAEYLHPNRSSGEGVDITAIAYDSQNRITTITYDDGLVDTFTYLANGNVDNIANAVYTETFTYDANNNITAIAYT